MGKGGWETVGGEEDKQGVCDALGKDKLVRFLEWRKGGEAEVKWGWRRERGEEELRQWRDGEQ